MVQAIQDYIGGLNWGYKVELRDKAVKYINAYGEIQSANTIKTTNKRGKVNIYFHSRDFFLLSQNNFHFCDMTPVVEVDYYFVG